MAYFLIPSLKPQAAPESLAQKSKHMFVERVARAVGLTAIEDASVVPPEDSSIRDALADMQKLKDAGIISSFGRVDSFPDEPSLCAWWADGGSSKCGGLSVNSDHEALRATVSEALERHIWARTDDYFANRIVASFRDLTETRATDPLRFAGYSAAQRLHNPNRLHVSADTNFLWIDSYSLTRERPIAIPAQIVSTFYEKNMPPEKKEPRIRDCITTGLATHRSKTEALLGGVLEVIERDAFMIMWLNELPLPRIAHNDIMKGNPALEELLKRCVRYRLFVHFVRLITDAPAYALMAVVRDPRMLPPIAVGLCAHASMSRAAEKALLEALRARKNARARVRTYGKPFTKKPSEVNFAERHLYWADPSHTPALDFLTQGEETALEESVWNNDDPKAHLERIIDWCRGSGYECIVVDLGKSKKNVLGLDIVFVVIPELQPLYLNEARRYEGGERLKLIPRKFDYAPRETLFTDVPHPFV